MTRKKALAELIEKVEAGEYCDHVARIRGGFDGGDLASFTLAFEGSLDAAKALHEAVLPGWDWVIGRTNDGLTIHANVGNEAEAFDDCPARAWLLAILRALQERAE